MVEAQAEGRAEARAAGSEADWVGAKEAAQVAEMAED